MVKVKSACVVWCAATVIDCSLAPSFSCSATRVYVPGGKPPDGVTPLGVTDRIKRIGGNVDIGLHPGMEVTANRNHRLRLIEDVTHRGAESAPGWY